jgi:hypothetical protein
MISANSTRLHDEPLSATRWASFPMEASLPFSRLVRSYDLQLTHVDDRG